GWFATPPALPPRIHSAMVDFPRPSLSAISREVRPETLAKVANVADAAARAKFPGWNYVIKTNDGYVFTAPVSQFTPNAFGLYDMRGNAEQWCADSYHDGYYDRSPGGNANGPNR